MIIKGTHQKKEFKREIPMITQKPEEVILSAIHEVNERVLYEAYEEGMEIGLKEGRKIGWEIGLKEGREIGLKEGKIKGMKKIAKKFKNQIDIQELSKITELSIKEIEEL